MEIQQENIPSIDLSAFTTTDKDGSDRQATAKKLGEVASRHGCVAIKGHGIPQERLDKAFQVIKSFYDLPYNDKMKAPHPEGPMPHRGYSGPGREKVSGLEKWLTDDARERERLQSVSDYKETYEIGSEDNAEQPNVWPPDKLVPEFRSFMTEFYWELHRTAINVLEALMMALQLPAEECQALRQLHTGHNNQLRLAHYPPIPAEMAANENLFRLAAHRDFSSFTLLFQDENSGLEFQNRETGKWMSAKPEKGYLILNIADIFDRFSNGRFPSSYHRVVFPSLELGQITTPSRYTIPYFVATEGDAIISPLASLVSADGKTTYESISFNDYCVQRMTAIQNETKWGQ